jgi:hypothetical protein
VKGLVTHALFAEALAETGDWTRARRELESALLCPGEPSGLAEVHARLAELLSKHGLLSEAKQHARAARSIDAENPRVKQLKL